MKRLIKYTLAFVCFISACHVSQKSQAVMEREFEIQGHRGARGLMPENTIPAMISALDLGVHTLEMDVVVSKDKKIVVSHEPWFAREITTLPDGNYLGPRQERTLNIYWMTYDQVKTFDVGLKPNPEFPDQKKIKAIKPLLVDLIDSVNEAMKTRRRPLPIYNIETKLSPQFDNVFHPEPAEFAELLMNVIKEKNLEERVTISSFDLRILKYLHEHYPAIKTSLLIDALDYRSLDDQLTQLGFIPTVYSPYYRHVNKSLVKAVHAKKMRIIPWTVNRKEKILELRKIGIDGIITDYPNLLNE